MNRDQQQEVLRRLDRAREVLDARPASPDELTAVIADLSFVERVFRWDLAKRAHRWRYVIRAIGPLYRALVRLRGLKRPKIGTLHHYEPRTLRLPRRYFATAVPRPAPCISVVTPTYQHGHFLDRTILSVLTQRYPSLEYVVQDGGSTDETVAILERRASSLTTWVSEPDAGQADAINRAFARTHGEIMGWLNSDDVLLPGALSCIAAFFAAHPDIDAVYGNRLMIDESDHEIGAWVLPKHDDLAFAYVDYVPQETLYWRRRLWEATGGYVDASYGYALDWELLLRFRDAGARFARIPRFLGAFRVHDEQKTTASLDLGLEETAALRRRTHGRPVSIEEAVTAVRPYLRSHLLAHLAFRTRSRLVGPFDEVTPVLYDASRVLAASQPPALPTPR